MIAEIIGERRLSFVIGYHPKRLLNRNQLGRQVIDVNLAATGHHRQPATGVLKLADVAGPGQGGEVFLGFRAQYFGFHGQFPGSPLEEMFH